MENRWIVGLALALGLSMGAVPAAANDTVASMQAGGLRFEQTAGISMLSEDLYLSSGEVRVTYRFLNHTDEGISTLVAFPMPDVEPGWISDAGGDLAHPERMLPFLTWADGQPVYMEVEQRAVVGERDVSALLEAHGVPLNPYGEAAQLALEELSEAALAELEAAGAIDRGPNGDDWGWPRWTLKTTHYWTQYFPPGEEVEIRHIYVPAVGGTSTSLIGVDADWGEVTSEYRERHCVDDAFEQAARRGRERGLHYTETWLDYVLTTGANWAGPIREFRMVVDKGSENNLVSFCGTGVRRISPTQFEVRYENYTPDRDMNVLILNGFQMD
ncbi:DUF4424 family protein [Brevundimonas aveniformis]|uniref:DUF4424 family protein n=1 Tax=Brevundimonas aveniformis TaxID=370977 RepID=UPI002490C8C5|nr:DUF4424 family protein [Brevundimonas aveniformis]